MSKPISTIVVHISTSTSPISNPVITFDMSLLFNWPCAIPIVISGSNLLISFFKLSILEISFWTIKHCPPLETSLVIASLINWFVWIFKNDLILILFTGGEWRNENSFRPEKIKFIVLGIGVAERYKMWIFSCLDLIRSFCFIPNLCSSSTISNPTLEKSIPEVNNAWVPINISISLLLNELTIDALFFDPECLFKSLIFTGKFLYLCKKDS